MSNTRIEVVNKEEPSVELTVDLYAENIPPCCYFRTYDEHITIGLCWSLIYRIEHQKPFAGMCDMCDVNTVSPIKDNK